MVTGVTVTILAKPVAAILMPCIKIILYYLDNSKSFRTFASSIV